MQDASGTLRLSSSVTFFLRYLPPAFWFAVLIAGIFASLSPSSSQSLFMLIAGAAGFLWSRATAFQLCNVWANPEGLVVVRGRKRAFVPYGSIRGARQRHAFGFTEVLLSQPNVFGQVVLFVPYLAQVFPYGAEHPAALLIQVRAARAMAGGA